MVKISTKTILAGGLLTAISVSPSCGKYEDGPGFSLASKKSRLAGTWELDKLTYSDGSIADLIGSVEIEFEKDGDYSSRSTSTYTDNYGSSYSYTNTTNGEWEFSSDKEEIEFEDNDGDNYDWEIKRLTNKELWVEDEYGNEWEWEKE